MEYELIITLLLVIAVSVCFLAQAKQVGVFLTSVNDHFGIQPAQSGPPIGSDISDIINMFESNPVSSANSRFVLLVLLSTTCTACRELATTLANSVHVSMPVICLVEGSDEDAMKMVAKIRNGDVSSEVVPNSTFKMHGIREVPMAILIDRTNHVLAKYIASQTSVEKMSKNPVQFIQNGVGIGV